MSALFPASMWNVENTGRRYVAAPDVTSTCVRNDGVPVLNPGPFQEEFVLQTRIEVRFVANKAEYQGALRSAERLLTATFYKDTLHDLASVAMLIQGGRTADALLSLDRLRTKLVE